MMRQIPQGLAAEMPLCTGLQFAKSLLMQSAVAPSLQTHYGKPALSDSHMFEGYSVQPYWFDIQTCMVAVSCLLTVLMRKSVACALPKENGLCPQHDRSTRAVRSIWYISRRMSTKLTITTSLSSRDTQRECSHSLEAYLQLW